MDRADTGGVLLKLEILCLVSIFLFVAFASIYKLKESPAFWIDEGYVLQASKNLALHGVEELQVSPGVFVSAYSISIGFPVIAPIALSFKLFGFGLLQARAVMVLYILAFCMVSYALIRALFGTRTALWSLLALSSYAALYGNGRAVLGEVPGLFFLMLTFFFLLRLEKSKFTDMYAYALAGLVAGLCCVTKPIFILMLPAVGIVYLVRYRRIPLRWDGIAVAFLLFVIPVILWVHSQFGNDTSLSQVLNFFINPQDSDFSVAIPENIKRFFTELTPVYTLALTGVWGIALYIRRKIASTTEFTAFAFCVLVMLAYLRTPGWYRYIFLANTVALVFLAPAILTLYEKGSESLRLLRRFPWAPSVLIALLFIMQTYQLFTTSYLAAYFNSTRTHDLETYIATLPKDSSVFFDTVPEAAFFAPSDNYYQYIRPHETFGIFGADSLPRVAHGDFDYIVMITGGKSDADLSKYKPVQKVNRYTILQRK